MKTCEGVVAVEGWTVILPMKVAGARQVGDRGLHVGVCC